MPRPGSGLILALIWLTRLPVARWLPNAAGPLAGAAWAFPLVGLILGGIAAAVYALAVALGLGPTLAAILATGAMIRLSGAMHEDGLADFADGMGGATPEARLAIMRDSRIGSYGVLTLAFVLGLRVAALAEMPHAAAIAALLTAPAIARVGMAVAMRLMPPARRDGLGRAAGRPEVGAVQGALGLGAAILLIAALLPGGWGISGAILAALGCAVAQVIVARKATTALGGQTGDVLGALEQAGETAALVILLGVSV